MLVKISLLVLALSKRIWNSDLISLKQLVELC